MKEAPRSPDKREISSLLPTRSQGHAVNQETADSGSTRYPRTWEQEVEDGNESCPEMMAKEDQERNGEGQIDSTSSNGPAHSVVFLLHSGQPLSYLASLISAEGFATSLNSPSGIKSRQNQQNELRSQELSSDCYSPYSRPIHITFHSDAYPFPGPSPRERWSPATSLGSFLRTAARNGSFTICIGDRRVCVYVPSFSSRTVFLRTALSQRTREIVRLTKVKDEYDHVARKSTHRVAVSGAAMLGSWWIAVGYLTFHTDLGWDTMEPITYLIGLGTVISGYLWFLWHNREVSYRSVLTETTSRQQRKLYAERGFDIDRYNELVGDAIELRKSIKRVALDYGIEWDQGHTDLGQDAQRALAVVRKEEARTKGDNRQQVPLHDESDESEGEEEAVIAKLDMKKLDGETEKSKKDPDS